MDPIQPIRPEPELDPVLRVERASDKEREERERQRKERERRRAAEPAEPPAATEDDDGTPHIDVRV